jgi:hypothetical protein
MVKRLIGICCALFLLASASGAVAAGTKARGYNLGGAGQLLLAVPESWQDEIKPGENGMPPTIVFHPAGSAAFKVMVTPVAPRAGVAMPSLDVLRADVERGRAKAAPQAVEKHIVVHELRGPEAAGYYFTATDKAPGSGPDDYRVMTPAEVVVGRVLLVVTVFSNDDRDKVREQALAMLKSAKFQAAHQDSAVSLSKVPAGYEVSVPASGLILTLPQPYLVPGEGAEVGSAASPRYFILRDRAQGLIISGWFEPADGFPGIQTFWKNETAGWKKNGLPDPVDVVFKKVGNWDAIAYDMAMPAPNANDTHLRAELVQAGTWIDLHLSMTSSLPSAEARAKLEAVLKGFQVREKAK